MPIKFGFSRHRRFIKFLNRELPTANAILLWEKPRHDTIEVYYEGGETEKVFALFSPEKYVIVWPSMGDREITYTSLAHEYVHAWQLENGMAFDEDEADEKANALYDKFMDGR